MSVLNLASIASFIGIAFVVPVIYLTPLIWHKPRWKHSTFGACGRLAAMFLAILVPAAALGADTVHCDGSGSARCKVRLSTGITMAYVETGPKTGEPVVLIHGYTDNIRIWSPAMTALHKRDPGLHIFAVDLRGHGASTMPPLKSCAPAPENCFQVRDFARDIVAFLAEKAVPKTTLVGHSLGSYVVQEVALSHPELVERAVLVSTRTEKWTPPPGFDFPPFTAWRKTLEARGKKFPTEFYNLTPKDVGLGAIEWINKDYVADTAVDQALVMPYAQSVSRVKLGTWIGAARGGLAFDSTKRLSGIAVPTLVLWGSQDPIDPGQKRLRDALDAAAGSHGTTSYWKQYGVRPLPKPNEPQTDIGHNVQWDAPDMAASDIDSFIRHDAPTSDLVHSDAPPNTPMMVVESGKATVIRLGK